MPATNVQPTVVELMEGWSFSQGIEITTGMRTFIDAAALPQYTPIELPLIGASFDNDWPLITCKKIDVKYKEPRPSCPRIYVCSYDSKPTWSMANLTQPPPPITTISIGADQFTYTNPLRSASSGNPGIPLWNWDSQTGPPAVDLGIGQMEYTETISKTRYIYPGNDLTNWREIASILVGHLNTAAFDIYAVGELLFIGADLTEMTNETDVRMWKADLKFRCRYVTDDATPPKFLDWNYVFDPKTGRYRLLVNSVTNAWLYHYSDFGPLFAACLPTITSGAGMPLGALTPPPPPSNTLYGR